MLELEHDDDEDTSFKRLFSNFFAVLLISWCHKKAPYLLIDTIKIQMVPWYHCILITFVISLCIETSHHGVWKSRYHTYGLCHTFKEYYHIILSNVTFSVIFNYYDIERRHLGERVSSWKQQEESLMRSLVEQSLQLYSETLIACKIT